MDKKREILEAAFVLFCEKGCHLSMSELAGMVGIKTPSLYSHFNNKDQILETMVTERILHFYTCLQQKMKDLSCKGSEETMRSLYLFILAYYGESNRLRFWRGIPFIEEEALRNTCIRLIAQKDGIFHEQMQSCFSSGKARGEIRSDAGKASLHLYFSMMQGVLDGMLFHQDEKVEIPFSEELFAAYWAGIKTLRTHAPCGLV